MQAKNNTERKETRTEEQKQKKKKEKKRKEKGGAQAAYQGGQSWPFGRHLQDQATQKKRKDSRQASERAKGMYKKKQRKANEKGTAQRRSSSVTQDQARATSERERQ